MSSATLRYVDNAAQFDELIEVMADRLDCYLTPPDGADLAAGKAVIRQLAKQSQAQFEQMHRLERGNSSASSSTNTLENENEYAYDRADQ
jgi:hypothetical protein